MNTFSFEQIFFRQLLLPQIGPDGQLALSRAHVAIAGLGAVGGRTAELLCRAGVGRLTIIDRDFVEHTNLPRQVLYTWQDAEESRPKPETFRRHLNNIMPSCHVYPRTASLGAGNVAELLGGAHIVADGTDNLETRYIINDWCVENGIPWVYAAAAGTKASVFPVLGRGACLRCAFPEPPALEEVPSCGPEGVLGCATALAAAHSATLVIRIIVGDIPEPLWRTWDIWTGEYSCISAEKLKSATGSSRCPVCCTNR